MILVDDQAGSKDLFPYIKSMTPDVILTRISCGFGDMVWAGEGPDGKSINVAIEYKKIDDVLACIGDGRFAGHQLPGLLLNYDRVYLLVEGRTRIDRNSGILQKHRGDQWRDVEKGGRKFTFRDLEHWYTSMEELAQVRVINTYDEYQSARYVVAKHSWWTAKGYDEHSSLKQFHIPPPPAATFVKPGVLRRVAKELTGVGWDRSVSVEAKFKSVREMCNASERTWQEIDGIGPILSNRIVKEIGGE